MNCVLIGPFASGCAVHLPLCMTVFPPPSPKTLLWARCLPFYPPPLLIPCSCSAASFGDLPYFSFSMKILCGYHGHQLNPGGKSSLGVFCSPLSAFASDLHSMQHPLLTTRSLSGKEKKRKKKTNFYLFFLTKNKQNASWFIQDCIFDTNQRSEESITIRYFCKTNKLKKGISCGLSTIKYD